MNDPQTVEPAESDNPAAYALARHITEQPMSTVLAALRILGWPITFELQPAGGAQQPEAQAAPEQRHTCIDRTSAPGRDWECQHCSTLPESLAAAPAAVQTEEA